MKSLTAAIVYIAVARYYGRGTYFNFRTGSNFILISIVIYILILISIVILILILIMISILML